MAQNIPLKIGTGYDRKVIPTVPVDVFGTVYRARRPKSTTPLLIAEVQAQFAGLGELEGMNGEEVNEALGGVRDSVRKLVRAMFDEADTDALVDRMVDPAEPLDLRTIFDVYTAVQTHFADDIEEEFADMGLEAPQAVKKRPGKQPADRRPAARKTAARKTAARKAVARK